MGVVEQALRRPAPSRAHGRAHRERSPGRGRRSWLHRWDQVDGCVQFSAQKRRLSTEASAPGDSPVGLSTDVLSPCGSVALGGGGGALGGARCPGGPPRGGSGDMLPPSGCAAGEHGKGPGGGGAWPAPLSPQGAKPGRGSDARRRRRGHQVRAATVPLAATEEGAGLNRGRTGDKV